MSAPRDFAERNVDFVATSRHRPAQQVRPPPLESCTTPPKSFHATNRHPSREPTQPASHCGSAASGRDSSEDRRRACCTRNHRCGQRHLPLSLLRGKKPSQTRWAAWPVQVARADDAPTRSGRRWPVPFKPPLKLEVANCDLKLANSASFN